VSDVSVADLWTLFWPSILASGTAAALSGLLGFFVVIRRLAFVSAALGQVSGLVVVLGFLLGIVFGHGPHEPTPIWLDPVVIAIIVTGLVAAGLAWLPRVGGTTPESAVAFVYLGAAAAALIVLANPAIVQEAHEVGDLLFGSSVAVRREHLIELVVVALVVGTSFVFLFKDLVFVSFDPEMARTLGLPVTRLELWLHLCIGISVAVATRAIGALPVFGFLVLPAGAALLVSRSVVGVVILSVIGALLAAAAGFYLSFIESVPTGPMMVITAAMYWPLAAIVRLLRRGR
jgi:zinc transport system permease protein